MLSYPLYYLGSHVLSECQSLPPLSTIYDGTVSHRMIFLALDIVSVTSIAVHLRTTNLVLRYIDHTHHVSSINIIFFRYYRMVHQHLSILVVAGVVMPGQVKLMKQNSWGH